MTIALPTQASDTSELGLQAKTLYAANKLDDAFNVILQIPQEERTAQQWVLMGNIMMDYDKRGDAEYMYNSALKADPKYYKASYNLANMYLADGQPNKAIVEYKNTIKMKKDFAHAHYNLGCAYLKIGELQKAKTAFLDAIYYKPTEADFHYNLAYVYKQLNNKKSAQMYLDYYNKIKSNN